MKILFKVIFISLTFFSIINAQSLATLKLQVPNDQIRVKILAEGSNDLFRDSSIENTMKLQLRRNNIEYFRSNNEVDNPSYPYLYINLHADKLNSGDVYGQIEIKFKRHSLFNLTVPEIYDESSKLKDIVSMPGKGPFFSVATWSIAELFYIPSRYNYEQRIKDIITDLVDEFSALYIDANNL
tara:strand:+ start:66 stop:614 length:549 start_codon:yes stop_codon:yes gene_type:complete